MPARFIAIIGCRQLVRRKVGARADFMDNLVLAIFYQDGLGKKLKLKQVTDGVSADAVSLANGRYIVDAAHSQPRSGGTRVKPAKGRPKQRPEASALGCRPHRHSTWNPAAAQKMWLSAIERGEDYAGVQPSLAQSGLHDARG
jgi:hypothetical protein